MHRQFTAGMGNAPSTSSNQHGLKGQDALYDPANFRVLMEQRDEIHQQRAQTTLECPLKALEEASRQWTITESTSRLRRRLTRTARFEFSSV